jgi:hypothetical protein
MKSLRFGGFFRFAESIKDEMLVVNEKGRISNIECRMLYVVGSSSIQDH